MNSKIANSLFSYIKNVDKETNKYYQSTIESLMWPAIYTCLNIAYIVGVLNGYSSNPEYKYYNLIIQLYRYLSKTLNLKITYITNSKNNLVDYVDSGYAELIYCQKFISINIFILFNRLFIEKLYLGLIYLVDPNSI